MQSFFFSQSAYSRLRFSLMSSTVARCGLSEASSHWFASLFSGAELCEAYADAEKHIFSSVGGTCAAKKLIRDQGDKAQFSVTLSQLHAEDSLILPASILHVARTLEAAAKAHLRSVLADQLGMSATKGEGRNEALIMDGLEKKSVFRIWRYAPGSCCRAHYDPGLVTAMLLGSRSGLQLNFSKIQAPVGDLLGNYVTKNDHSVVKRNKQHLRRLLEPTAAPGEPVLDDVSKKSIQQDLGCTGDAPALSGRSPSAQEKEEEDDDSGWIDAAALRTSAADDVLIISNTLLQVVTAERVRHVLHRVVSADAAGRYKDTGDEESTTQIRFNMVLELRPPNARALYAQEVSP